MVIVMHGRGDSSEGFEWLQGALNIPSLNFLLLNAPDPYYGGYSWYDLPPNQLPGILRSRQLLEKLMEDIERNNYKLENCVLLGFSQGCLMTLEFGGRFARALAGYVGISGYCLDPKALLRERSGEAIGGNWLITHGTEDEVLPVEVTRAQIEELQKGGFPIDYREFVKSHTIDPESELPYIRDFILRNIRKGSLGKSDV